MDQKMTGAKKVTLRKNQFLRACQPCEEILEFHSCSGFIFITEIWNFDQLFQNNGTFFQKFFWLKSLLMISTISDQMGSENQQKWPDSSN